MLLVAGAFVHAKTGAFVPLKTAARVLVAVGLCLGVGLVMPHFGRLATPVAAAVVAALYVALLAATGELGAADFAMLRAIGGKRAARAA
jgi:glucose dehydrogenase